MKKIVRNASVIAALACAVGLGVGAVAGHRAGKAPPEDGLALVATKGAPAAFGWKKGSSYTYDVALTTRSAARINLQDSQDNGAARAQTVDGASDLAGTFTLRAFGANADGVVLAVSFDPSERHALVAMGADLLEGAQAVAPIFKGAEAFAVFTPEGALRTIYFQAGASPIFKQVLQSVLGQAQAVLPGERGHAAWETVETTNLGKLAMHYAVDDADGLRFTRNATIHELTAIPPGVAAGTTPTLAATAEITLAEAGHVTQMTSREELVAASPVTKAAPPFEHHATFSMTLRNVTPFDAPTEIGFDKTKLEEVVPGQRPGAADMRTRMDEHFAARTSLEEIDGMLTSYLGGVPLPKGAMVSTASFLRLHGDACAVLGSRFLDDSMSHRGRQLLMDVLASAGSPAAQAAMRKALDLPSLKSDPKKYAELALRLGFVKKPEPETLAYLEALYAGRGAEAANAALRHMAALTLGASAGHAYRTGDVATAQRVTAKLSADLATATGRTKAGLLLAVGNTAMRENAPLISKYAKDADSDVRQAAARALRDVDTAAVRGTLLEMLDDENDGVARAALGSYDQRPLGGADMMALADRVSSGMVNEDVDVALLSVVQSHTDEREPAERILRKLLGRVHGNGEQEAKIRLLLRRARGEDG